MERRRLPFEPVRRLSLRLTPVLGAGEARFRRKIENEGQVRHGSVYDDPLDRVEASWNPLAHGSLVGPGRIRETVARDVDALVESRPDRPLQVVEARRRKEQRLRERARTALRGRSGSCRGSAPLLRSARLPRDHDLMTDCLDPAVETFDLGRLAGPLPAFESDEMRHLNRGLRRLEKARRTQPAADFEKPVQGPLLILPRRTSSPA